MSELTATSGRCLLDTSIVIALFGHDSDVVAGLQDTDETFVPAIVLGELYFGAYRSRRRDGNLAQVDEFAAASVVVACDTGTARHYGSIKDGLRGRGTPIPENDVWIAALALQHNLTLVTRDAHFGQVDGLDIASW